MPAPIFPLRAATANPLQRRSNSPATSSCTAGKNYWLLQTSENSRRKSPPRSFCESSPEPPRLSSSVARFGISSGRSRSCGWRCGSANASGIGRAGIGPVPPVGPRSCSRCPVRIPALPAGGFCIRRKSSRKVSWVSEFVTDANTFEFVAGIKGGYVCDLFPL